MNSQRAMAIDKEQKCLAMTWHSCKISREQMNWQRDLALAKEEKGSDRLI
jgi:hypothetical protein